MGPTAGSVGPPSSPSLPVPVPPADELTDAPRTRIDPGVAGSSARAEHQRRQSRRKQNHTDRYGSLVAAALDLRKPPQHEEAWRRGAVGEERVAKRLAELGENDVIVLHDRRVPRSRANIDHIAITRTGIWVIDTKRYKGAIRVERSLLRAPKLKIGGRDQTKLVAALSGQIGVVNAALTELDAQPPIHGALCFVDGDIPILGLPAMGGVQLTTPKRLTKLLTADGPLSSERVAELARAVAGRLPPANP